jgi:hypothetical protein
MTSFNSCRFYLFIYISYFDESSVLPPLLLLFIINNNIDYYEMHMVNTCYLKVVIKLVVRANFMMDSQIVNGK